MERPEIKAGAVYSNGDFGKRWVLRQVLAIEPASGSPEDDLVRYKVLAGSDRRARQSCSRAEFRRWARYEVVRNENSWERVTEESGD